MTTIDELKRILALPDSASKKNIVREAIAEIEALRDDNAELRNQVTQLSTELSDLKLKKNAGVQSTQTLHRKLFILML